MKHPSSFLPGGTQAEGHFYLTLRKRVSDGIHHSKFLCNPHLRRATLKPPALTLEPEHLILGAKGQKAPALEAFICIFVIVLSFIFTLTLTSASEEKGKDCCSNTLPTAFLLPLLISQAAPSSPAEPAQL